MRGAGVDPPTVPGDEELHCVEHYLGEPLSYVTTRAADGLRALAASALVLPTTTRTVEQLARVLLPGATSGWAVAANGGVLLVDSERDGDWDRAVERALRAGGASLAEVQRHLEGVLDPAWTSSLRSAQDLFAYAVVDRPALPHGLVDDLTGWAAGRGWVTSLQGRKLYLVPRALTKHAAVAEVARRRDVPLVLSAGDSLLDAELLEHADAAVRPAHGELHQTGWVRPHVTVTAAAGARGGEQVVDWLLDRVRRATGDGPVAPGAWTAAVGLG
ncbi:HAD family hydrolase [Angustibacter aerolatus]